jgi:phosphatidylglycerophosphate synthase
LAEPQQSFLRRYATASTPLGAGLTALGRALVAILSLALFIVFLGNHWLPVWGFITIYICEFIPPYLRVFAQQAGRPIAPRWSGRLRVAAYLVAQAAIIVEAVWGRPIVGYPIALTLFWVAVASAVIYLLDHVVVALARLADSRKPT